MDNKVRRMLATSLLPAMLIYICLLVTIGYFYFYSYETQYRIEIEAQLESVARLKAQLVSQSGLKQIRDSEIQMKNPQFTEFLDSILQILGWWPTSSQSAETVMIYEDSTGVLVINPNFSDTSGAIHLTRPYEDVECTCFHVSRDYQGPLSGNDCNGRKVIAYAVAVSGTPWTMITRMDRSEVYSPIRERFWTMIIVFTLLFFLMGTIIGFLIRHQRVNYYKHLLETEKRLSESESRYRLLYENSNEAILMTTPDGRILSANPRASKIFGYTEEEIIQIGRDGLVDASDPRLAIAIELRQQTGSFNGELTMLRANLEPFEAEVSSSVYTTLYGEKRTSMIIRDITERKNFERNLYESEEKFQKAFISAPYALVITTPGNGTILEVNRGFTDITGFEAEEVLGKTMPELNIWYNPAERDTVVRELREKSLVYRKVSMFRRKSGEIMYGLFNAELMTIKNQTVILSAIDDITEQKSAEEKLRKEMTRLELLNEQMVDRELLMIELKKEIAMLKEEVRGKNQK